LFRSIIASGLVAVLIIFGASLALAQGLPNVERRAWSLWVDPVAFFMKN
jgi:hypothetical protein